MKKLFGIALIALVFGITSCAENEVPEDPLTPTGVTMDICCDCSSLPIAVYPSGCALASSEVISGTSTVAEWASERIIATCNCDTVYR